MCRVATLLKTARGGGFSKNPYFEPYLQKSPIFLTTTFQKGEIKILQIQWNSETYVMVSNIILCSL